MVSDLIDFAYYTASFKVSVYHFEGGEYGDGKVGVEGSPIFSGFDRGETKSPGGRFEVWLQTDWPGDISQYDC